MNEIEKSRQAVKDQIRSIIERVSPYPLNDGYELIIDNVSFDDPDTSFQAQESAFDRDATLETNVKGNVRIVKDGEDVVPPQKSIILGKVPCITERGTYIVKGNEKIILNQMTLRPGIYVHPKKEVDKTEKIGAEIRVGKQRGFLELDLNRATLRLHNLTGDYGARGTNIDVFPLLRILGATEADIKEAIGEQEEYESLNTSKQSIEKIYESLFKGDYPGEEEAKQKIRDLFEDKLAFDEKGQRVIKHTLGIQASTVGKATLLSTIREVMREKNKPGSAVVADDIRFKEVASRENIITRHFEKGLLAFLQDAKSKVYRGTLDRQVRPTMAIKNSMSELYQSNLTEQTESPNPLALWQEKRKVTVMGQGGLTPDSAGLSNRHLYDMSFSKIDPVETPQSDKLGLVQHLAKDADIKNGFICSKFYRVKDGKIDKNQIIDDMDPMDEFEEYVAFNDPRQVSPDGTRLIPKNVEVRHRGSFMVVPREKVTLIDKSPISHLSHATNLIPFVAHNDGARVLMGANMQKQSMSLVDPEEPLVQNETPGGNTVEEEVAKQSSFLLHSPTEGKVVAIEPEKIVLEGKDGQTHEVKKLNYFATGKAGGYINHTPIVKVGDTVKEGQLLADGWQSKNGKMALGKNVMVAYMPFEGYNFEDGVVISESMAKKMSSEEIKVIEVDLLPEWITGRDGVKTLRSLRVSDGLLRKLDGNGIIKKGENVEAGTVLVAAAMEVPKEKQISKLLTTQQDRYRDKSYRAQGYQKGKVINVKTVSTGEGQRVVITLLSYKPMDTGDKIAGRHGNKGVITKILPDEEMPRTEDGKRVELIFSPLAVPSRKNLGQLLEVNAGLIAQKTGKPFVVKNFDPTERQRVMQGLKDIGVEKGKMTLINPATGKPYENKITVGPMYIMKLKHKAESKVTARNFDLGSTDHITYMPKKISGSIDGERRNPQSVGGMEFWSLTSGGAVHNIHEMTTLKSDGAGDLMARKDIFHAIRRGEKIKDPVTPQTLKVLQDHLFATGLQMTPLKDGKEVTLDESFAQLALEPARAKTMRDLHMKKVTTHKSIDARTKKAESGGLSDETIFGKDSSGWGYIELPEPMPNPLFLDSHAGAGLYQAMLNYKGISSTNLANIVEKGKYIVLDPKNSGLKKYEVIDAKKLEEIEDEDKEIEAETGGVALRKLLEGVNMQEATKHEYDRLQTAKSLSERNNISRNIRILNRLMDTDAKPTDFMMTEMPVLPLKYRPAIPTFDGKMLVDDGLTRMYQKLMRQNIDFEKGVEGLDGDKTLMGYEHYSKNAADRYKTIKQIYGIGEPMRDTKTQQPIKGILARLSSKTGFLREKMQSKAQDYSGRSVITVDPTLNMNEVGLPEDMARVQFKPHILRKLMKKGYTIEQQNHFYENRTKEYRAALEEVAAENPVILNRQPSLHRHSAQAFFPKIRWNSGRPDRAIGMNPLVVTGFNADFDGDTMSVHVPITEAAKKEAIDKLMPSKNLLNPTNNAVIIELKHEMALGIYYMTRKKAITGQPKEFKDFAALRKAYDKGEVQTYDPVRMMIPAKGMITATAGQHLFNLCLPPAFRDYEKNVDVKAKDMTKIMEQIIQEPKLGSIVASQVMDKLKSVGFKTATYSGLSIGVRDFDDVLNVDRKKLFEQAAEKVRETNPAAELIESSLEFKQQQAHQAHKIIEDMVNNQELLSEDNPVTIMRISGARGKGQQVSQMAGVIGVGKNVMNEQTRPLDVSHLEGLSPQRFFDLGMDSRKGIFDKSIATRDPGALTRQIWMSNKQTIITEKDCGDTTGIVLNMEKDEDRRALAGRILLQSVTLENGTVIQANGSPLLPQDAEMIKSKAKEPHIHIRSSLTCKAHTGVCQKCYGARAGTGTLTGQLVPIGEPVGSIAAQALGEPSQQAIMRTFHTGGGTSNLSGAFKRIQQVLTEPLDSSGSMKAILAKKSGMVTKIVDDPIRGKSIFIGKTKHEIHRKPIANGIRVGVQVEAGDPLTAEFDAQGNPITFRDAREVMQHKGPQAAKDYLIHSLEQSYRYGGISDVDRRHMEVVVSNMFGTGQVVSPGTTSFTPGQHVPVKAISMHNDIAGQITSMPLDFANKMNMIGKQLGENVSDLKNPLKFIGKKGDIITEQMWEKMRQQRKNVKVKAAKVTFEQHIKGVGPDNTMPDNNWLSHAAYRGAKHFLGLGAVVGAVDKLDNPLTRQMTGLKGNFSDGFEEWKKANDMWEGFRKEAEDAASGFF